MLGYLSSLSALLATVALANFDIDSTPNAVGITYTVLQGLYYTPGVSPTPPDVTEIEHGDGTYAPVGTVHWWGRPEIDYYIGGDRYALDLHFEQLQSAMVDFIVIDATNVQGPPPYPPQLITEPCDVLMDEMLYQRSQGAQTPSVVYWARSEPSDSDPNAVIQYVIDQYYHNASYADLFVTLDGKPLIITTNLQPSQFTDEFTLRKMWAEEPIDEPGEWSFMQYYPQTPGVDQNNNLEQLSISPAQQRPYMSDASQGLGRNSGANFQQQWSRAFDLKPKVVMLSNWNEWVAIRQQDAANGNVQFVDEFDSEYSKDLEPQDHNQDGTHGRVYLDWLTQYVAAYKSNQPMPQGLTGYENATNPYPCCESIG